MKRVCNFLMVAALAAFGALLPVPPAHAQQQGGVDLSDVSRLTLLPGWQRDDGMYVAAIRVDLAPGWKTYWRAPGASGIAPSFNWSGSSNIAQVGYIWPTPEIFDAYGARTIGYENQLLLPVLIKPQDRSAPVRASLEMEYGVCEEICLPAHSTAQVQFDPTVKANKAAISSALERRAITAKSAGMQSATCRISPNGRDFILSAELSFSAKPNTPRAIVIETGSDYIWVSEPDHRLTGRALSIEADMQYYGDGTLSLNRSQMRFTLIGDTQTIDIRGCTGG